MKFRLFNILVFFFFLNPIANYSQNECQCKALISISEKELVDSLQFEKAIKALKKSNNKNCNFEILTLQFKNYKSKGQLDEALKKLEAQERLFSNLNCKNQFKYQLLENKINYYREINDLEKVSDYAFEALKEAEKLQDVLKEIEALQHIVFVFTRLNEDEKNWSYIKRTLPLIESLKSNKTSVKHYIWLALEYETKYTITERETLIDSALIFINKAKKTALKYKLNDELSEVYKVLEGCSYHKKEFDNAITYIDSSIFYAKRTSPVKNLGPLYIYKSWDLLEMNNFEEVKKNLDSAVKYDQSSGGVKMSFYHELSSIYEGIGKIDKALLNYKKYVALKDSIININTLEKVNDMEQKYNKVSNENKIVQLEKAEQLYFFLIIGSFLALLLLILFFRQRSLKNKQKIMLTEQRLNKARMNPHFFFNSMASLQNLSLEEESPKTTLFISRFAKIMRQSLENTYDDLITLENEIDFLDQYLNIQQLRYPDKFEYKFFVDDDLEVDTLKIPSMIIQPFVENAIEHGFKNLDYKGLLNLNFKSNEDILKIVIKDNGSGLNSKNIKSEHKSRAMQIIKDRLYLLNMQYKSKATYNLKTIDEDNGFEIEIILPKLYNI